MNGVVRRERLKVEQRRENRYQRHAAADAEQAGQEADAGAGDDVRGDPGHRMLRLRRTSMFLSS